MRIYLIGYSYSGKTTLGRQLAKRLNYKFFDTDKALEIKYHTTIPVFFNRYGEKAFRIIERQILQSTADLDNTVISTGGGTACSDDNIQFLLQHGTVVHLQMSVDEILMRLAKSHKTRPMLKDKEPDELKQFIAEQLKARLVYYNQAHLSVPALQTTAEELEKAVFKTPEG
jgi:shikimate kinase